MTNTTNHASVIIGRFQTPYLTEGHFKLWDAAKRKGRVVVLIGVTQAIGTDKNPMDYFTRRALFENSDRYTYDGAKVFSLPDYPQSDQDWSNHIDSIIEDLGYETATIFGGRDNAIEKHYKGKHDLEIIDAVEDVSATKLRKRVGMDAPLYSEDFRKGIIYHVENRYPIVYSTVDIAVVNITKKAVLMGRKGDDYGFVGGFVDPADLNYEQAAIRELKEETGIDTSRLEFLFSMKVEDERYAGTKDSIMTNLFTTVSTSDTLPQDEAIVDKEFKDFIWMPMTQESVFRITPAHKKLFLEFLIKVN